MYWVHSIHTTDRKSPMNRIIARLTDFFNSMHYCEPNILDLHKTIPLTKDRSCLSERFRKASVSLERGTTCLIPPAFPHKLWPIRSQGADKRGGGRKHFVI